MAFVQTIMGLFKYGNEGISMLRHPIFFISAVGVICHRGFVFCSSML